MVLSEICIKNEEVDIYTKLPGYHSYAKCNNKYRAGRIVVFVTKMLDDFIRKY